MKLSLTIPDSILAGVLDGAGSRYWCSGLDWPEVEDDSVCTCWEALLAGKIPYVDVTEDRSEEGEPSVVHRVTLEDIGKAVQVIAERYPHHLGDVLGGYEHGQADAETGDVLLQCAALGDIIYG